MGYNAGWGVFSAFQAGMEHERKRICIVANSISNGRNGLDKSRKKLLENNEIHILKERKSVESPILFEYALRKLGGDDGDEAAEDAWEHEGHVRTTMGVLNTFSVLLGVFVIFVLVAMLLGLFSWLKADILHSLTLLEGGIR